MSRSGSRYDEEFYRSSGKGSGHSSPRGGSRRDSRDIYGDFSPEISRRNERPQRRSSIGTRNFFTDALDDLERNLRKVEDESSLVMHDFVSNFVYLFVCLGLGPLAILALNVCE